MPSDAGETMQGVPLDRPPRPPAGAVTERVRQAIIGKAERLGISADRLVAAHADAEHIANAVDLALDVEERYGLPDGLIFESVRGRVELAAADALRGSRPADMQEIFRARGSEFLLLALPETEFLTVLEHAMSEDTSGYDVLSELLRYADEALRTHGAPYRRTPRQWRFEWVGDPKHHELTVEPALLALADPRLAGPQAEFEEALRKRRLGASKDLEDAVDEAAKAVESTLQVLHDANGVPRTGKEAVLALFTSLKNARVLPPYVVNLVTAAAGPRNSMASHGQGGTVRELREELADASIAAAATAITFLAHYLP